MQEVHSKPNSRLSDDSDFDFFDDFLDLFYTWGASDSEEEEDDDDEESESYPSV